MVAKDAKEVGCFESAWIDACLDRVHGCVFDMLKKMCKTHLSAAKQEIPDLDWFGTVVLL